jgi:hypothetical protein
MKITTKLIKAGVPIKHIFDLSTDSIYLFSDLSHIIHETPHINIRIIMTI